MTASHENTTLSVVRVNDDLGGSNTDVNLTVEEIFNPTNTVLKESSTEQDYQEKLGISTTEVTKMNGEKNGHSDDAIPKIGDSHLDAPDPLLNLDQEEIEKIEHALQSEQARQILGVGFSSILGQGAEAELDDLLDPELTGG